MNDDEYLEWQKKQQNRRRKMTRHERQAARRFYLGWLAVVLLIVLFVLLLSTTARSAAMPSQIAQESTFHASVSNHPHNASPLDMPAMEAEEKKEEDDGLPLDYLGRFTVTHYCPCLECCGKSETDSWHGITATGTTAVEGHTIAVDPAVIPHGSRVALFYDDGRIVEYIAEDSGVYGSSVDVFVDDHERAAQLGVATACVYLVREE